MYWGKLDRKGNVEDLDSKFISIFFYVIKYIMDRPFKLRNVKVSLGLTVTNFRMNHNTLLVELFFLFFASNCISNNVAQCVA